MELFRTKSAGLRLSCRNSAFAETKRSPEEFYWRIKKSLFPETEIPNPIPGGLPNDDSFLIVSLEKDGTIKLNVEQAGEIENTAPLTDKLREIFEYRQNRGFFEENTQNAVKVVAIKAPRSEKYGNIIKILDAVKVSGADPIVV